MKTIVIQSEDALKEFTQNMVNIPAGSFWARQTDEEQQLLRQWGWWKDHFNYERPRHQVKLAAFAIGKYPVTQAQWQAIMGNNPSHFQGRIARWKTCHGTRCKSFCKT